MLRISNEDSGSSVLDKAENYITGLRNANGQLVCEGLGKTALVGFICVCRSVKGVLIDLCKSNKMQYIPTYKFSQDHLEIYFSMIRSRWGFNNNPSVMAVRAAWKSLLVQNEVKAKMTGNCLPQDNTRLLCWEKVNTWDLDPVIFGNLRRLGLEPEPTARNYESDFCNVDTFSSYYLSEFSNIIVVYIAGFVARKVSTVLKCIECLTASGDAIPFCNFLNRKNNGGLYMPSKGLLFVCRQVERLIRNVLLAGNGKPQNGKTKSHIQHMLLTNLVSSNPFPQTSGSHTRQCFHRES